MRIAAYREPTSCPPTCLDRVAGHPDAAVGSNPGLRTATEVSLDPFPDTRYVARANLVSGSDGTAVSSSFLSFESGLVVRAHARFFLLDSGMTMMATGTVKWFNDAKGFGFIKPDDGGEDLFAHFSGINMPGFKTLTEGQRVTFDVTDGNKGKKQASNIQAAK